MDDVRDILKSGEKLEYFPVIFQELFLRVDFSSTKFFLKIFLHLSIFFGDPFAIFGGGPLVIAIRLRRSLRLIDLLIELSGVGITIIEVDGSSVDGKNYSHSDIVGSHELAIIFDVLFSLQEFSLRNS